MESLIVVHGKVLTFPFRGIVRRLHRDQAGALLDLAILVSTLGLTLIPVVTLLLNSLHQNLVEDADIAASVRVEHIHPDAPLLVLRSDGTKQPRTEAQLSSAMSVVKDRLEKRLNHDQSLCLHFAQGEYQFSPSETNPDGGICFVTPSIPFLKREFSTDECGEVPAGCKAKFASRFNYHGGNYKVCPNVFGLLVRDVRDTEGERCRMILPTVLWDRSSSDATVPPETP